MKKLVLVVLALTLAPIAQAADSSSGCGIGYEIAPKQSLLSSFARSLTNATFLNTIAMTFGTSGCAKHSIVMKDKEAQYFAEANYHNLMMEMAMGQGENLENFAAVLGCDANYFPAMMQSHYGEVFSTTTNPSALLENVRAAIQQDAVLTASCLPQG